MPGLYRDEGVVLKTIKLGEADRIVTFFTRHHGRLRGVAKGIRKTKSRFGARLEPLTRVEVMFYRGRGELDTVTQVDIVTAYKGLRSDYARLLSASAIAEIVEKVTPEREGAPAVYRLLVGALDALAQAGSASVVPAFLIKLLSVSGYHPQLSVCAGCGDGRDLAVFSPALGGMACHSCWQEDRDAIPLAHDRVVLLNRLLAGEFGAAAGAEATSEVIYALGRYAEFYIERPLRSLKMLTST